MALLSACTWLYSVAWAWAPAGCGGSENQQFEVHGRSGAIFNHSMGWAWLRGSSLRGSMRRKTSSYPQMVLQRGGGMAQHVTTSSRFSPPCKVASQLAQLGVLPSKSGMGSAERHGLKALGRAHQPADSGMAIIQPIQRQMAQVRHALRRSRHAGRQRRRAVGCTPQQANRQQDKRRHARPFVPGIRCSFSGDSGRSLAAKSPAPAGPAGRPSASAAGGPGVRCSANGVHGAERGGPVVFRRGAADVQLSSVRAPVKR